MTTEVNGEVTFRFAFDVDNVAPSRIAQIVQDVRIGGELTEVVALTLTLHKRASSPHPLDEDLSE